MDVEPSDKDLQSNEQIDNVLFLISAVIPSIAASSTDTFALIAGAPNVVANLRAAGISR